MAAHGCLNWSMQAAPGSPRRSLHAKLLIVTEGRLGWLVIWFLCDEQHNYPSCLQAAQIFRLGTFAYYLCLGVLKSATFYIRKREHLRRRVVGCRGGNRYVEVCWGFPYLKKFIGFLISWFLRFCFLVSWFQSFLVSTCQSFKDSMIPY